MLLHMWSNATRVNTLVSRLYHACDGGDRDLFGACVQEVMNVQQVQAFQDSMARIDMLT
jgi:hypothetical protein